jgi:hypothetical protein
MGRSICRTWRGTTANHELPQATRRQGDRRSNDVVGCDFEVSVKLGIPSLGVEA